MTQYPQASVDAVKNALTKYGIINPYLQAGILATVAKETGFVLRPEVGYKNTSNARIRSIFPSKLGNYTDAQLDVLKADDVKFFDAVYGGRYGNTAPGDGYKYRGRGFNGITFKDNYKLYGSKMGVDLVSNPDKLNSIPVAAESMALYYVENFKVGKNSGSLKAQIGVNDVSEIKDVKTATKAAVQATSGWNKSLLTSEFGKENHDKALSTVDYFMALISPENVTRTIKNNFLPLLIVSLTIGAGLFLILKK